MTDEVIEQKDPQPEKTFTQAEVDALVAGLKTNNEKLLSEKKEAKRIADEAAEAQRKADLERAQKEGDLVSLEKSLRGEYDKQLTTERERAGKLSERILGSERKSVINAVLAKGNFIDADAADLLTPFIKTEFDGDEVITKFIGNDGNVITTDQDQFIDWCKKHKVISHLMKADAATGGGAAGHKNPTGGGASGKMDAIDQRLKAKFG